MSETNAQAEIQLALSRGDVRLFRANAGKAWQGDKPVVRDGVLLLRNFRRIELFPAGTADLIGWKSVVVTSDDVGKKVAVFVGIEVKSLDGRYRKRQVNFRREVEKAGGLIGLARSVDEAKQILEV